MQASSNGVPNDGKRPQGEATSAPIASNPLPTISLPKGGGAIRGIGEKFATNPVTGTASVSVPIATSPGRSGFGPQLSLSYDSGAGNGVFGFGWSLSLPEITRKTDKGIPTYLDDQDSDVFIISGSEDLVPVLNSDNSRYEDSITVPGYTIHRFRPRIEKLYARIERWTSSGGDVHWRSISKDNILTIYGKDAKSRITDTIDSRRIFSWLICEVRDDKGNGVIYDFKPENSTNVDLTQANEANRGQSDDSRRSVNRHVKHIRYGNRVPLLDASGYRPRFLSYDTIEDADWMFEVVLDYGEHDLDAPKPGDNGAWLCRHDPFSSYRSGFEIRSYRLCQRILMFHHFANEANVGTDCLVRSMDFAYRSIRNNTEDVRKGHPIATLLASVTQFGYKRRGSADYLKDFLPPLEFKYSQSSLQEEVRNMDDESLENLPVGIDGSQYRWIDLNGEGAGGALTEQGSAWFYKANLSPMSAAMSKAADVALVAKLGPVDLVWSTPRATINGSRTQFLDLTGDGVVDLVQMQDQMAGSYKRDISEVSGWAPFLPFQYWPTVNTSDPNLNFIDLTGDGLADILITRDDALIWYPSLAEMGYGSSVRRSVFLDEEKGPRLMFADGTDSIYLADMTGDGMADIVRIRSGEICYWPNCGYGNFGSKVAMDDAPFFDYADFFSQRRIRLVDIDGSGACDIIYLGLQQSAVYYNQAGNSWSAAHPISPSFPCTDALASVQAVDLLGNGTACLVWSSPLPGHSQRPMRYIDLMGGQKPHLLTEVANNLGLETRLHYAPSTQFYLQDKFGGKDWATRLPFVVHVVEKVEIFDFVGRNRFLKRYAYHHGLYDGTEREFRGFGMVEEWDTESFSTFNENTDNSVETAANSGQSSHVPPMLTRTWYHLGVYNDSNSISNVFAGEYYREGSASDNDDNTMADSMLLDDTVLPQSGRPIDGTSSIHDLTSLETREACRSLKGCLLRQEVYALDESDASAIPYTVTEQNYTIQLVQPQHNKRHAVFAIQPREKVEMHYERKLIEIDSQSFSDPRTSHSMALQVDGFGNVLRSLTISYRRRPNTETSFLEQEQTHITLDCRRFANCNDDADWYRVGIPVEERTYELVNAPKPTTAGHGVSLFTFDAMFDFTCELFPLENEDPGAEILWPYESWDWASNETHSPPDSRMRLIEHVRRTYRRDDLGAGLSLGEVESRALPFQEFKLAFTPELAMSSFLETGRIDAGGLNDALQNEGGYVHFNGDPDWWIPSGRVFYSLHRTDTTVQELSYARQHFFLVQRYQDPFHTPDFNTELSVKYDIHDLLAVETVDCFGNRVTVGDRDANGFTNPAKPGNDYRVLQPALITDSNRNRTQLSFNVLGMVAGTAVKGRDDTIGDSMAAFEPDLDDDAIDRFFDSVNPSVSAWELLQSSSARIIYDLRRFYRSRLLNPGDSTRWLPAYCASLVRDTHVSDPAPPRGKQVQISFAYSDGLGREIQKKVRAEPGSVVDGGPAADPRWLASGWTIFNNKGKPVRQYEPFFSRLPAQGHKFEFAVQAGVSNIVFYDPVGRVVATLRPDHTYTKQVFDPWSQTIYDEGDTIAPAGRETGDPRTDPDIKGYVAEYFSIQSQEWQTWYQQRSTSTAATPEDEEQINITLSAQYANTPIIIHFDSLGREFMTVSTNATKYSDEPAAQAVVKESYSNTVVYDIEGNQRSIVDARDRICVRRNYDMLGNMIHESGMDSGQRWLLRDVVGKVIRSWNSRGHSLRTEYDRMRRPVKTYLATAEPASPKLELVVECTVYGEQLQNGEQNNLRTRQYLHLDQSGAVATRNYDFKGNLIHTVHHVAREYKEDLDWTAVSNTLPPIGVENGTDESTLIANLAPFVEDESFESHALYNALNRVIQFTASQSRPQGQTAVRNIIQPEYNESDLLDQVHVWLEHTDPQEGLLNPSLVPPSPVGVRNIDYNARSQRVLIEYKNGASTRYIYDPQTFRLINLYSRRGPSFTADCGGDSDHAPTAAPARPPSRIPCGLQNLTITNDPVGNITHIRDGAQQTLYFRNQRINPSASYLYDALYRLIEATGREHLGQNNGQPNSPTAPDAFNAFHTRIDHPNDGNAMGMYREKYVYDAVGNITAMHHVGTDPTDPGWTRLYQYLETSLIEDGTHGTLLQYSNRLTSSTIGSNNPVLETYKHDVHGNIVRMPHLGSPADPKAENMHYDYLDRLKKVDKGGGGTVFYTYSSTGQRVRQIWEKSPSLIEERVYVADVFECFRRRNGSGTINFERETLHIMDENTRIAMVETRTLDTVGNDSAPRQLIRYQIGNVIGSSCIELDEDAQIISYEEYTPFGSTAYQGVRSQLETPKRYRFTGKERDEATGFNYHGARYYAPWLARWISCDPAPLLGQASMSSSGQQGRDDSGSTDEETKLHKKRQEQRMRALIQNLYEYGHCNPLKFTDDNGRDPTIAQLEKMSMTQLWNTPVPQLQQYLVTASEWLLHQIAQEPIQHGMHRQTVEAALGELQSAELVGADARTYNHVQSFKNAVNGLGNPLQLVNKLLEGLRGNVDPSGSRVAAQGAQAIRPAMDLARNVVQAGQAFEEIEHELASSNNLTRLQGTPLETGKNMVTQLRSLRLDLLPGAIRNSDLGQNAFRLFNQLPATLQAAQNRSQEILASVGSALSAYAAAGRAVAQSLLQRAGAAALEGAGTISGLLIGLSSSLISVPLMIVPRSVLERGMYGSAPDGA